MTQGPVVLDDLVRAREELVADAVGRMPDAHRRFLLSFEKGEPDWALLDVSNVDRLPAVRWRMANLARLDGRRPTWWPVSKRRKPSARAEIRLPARAISKDDRNEES